jgi:hypothetical protein
MSNAKWLARLFLMSTAMITFYYLANAAYFGSLRQGFASIRGSELIGIPEMLDLGEIDFGKETSFSLLVKNVSWHKVVIEKCNVSCSCTKIDFPLPFELTAGSQTDVKFALKPRSNDNLITEEIVFQTRSGRTKSLTLKVVARRRPNI